MLIDKLNEQVKNLEDKLALVEAQLQAQGGETSLATQTLQQAASQMEVLLTFSYIYNYRE
jgi:hypothetical protein